MKNIYEILFYRIYSFLVALRHVDIIASLISLTLISLFLSLNVLTIFYFADYKLDNIINNHLYLFIIIWIFNIYLFFNNRYYLIIKNKYKDERKKIRRIRILLTILYILITFLIFLF